MHTYRYAALLYLEDPGALPFVYLLRRWGFAYSDHFVVALASPRISDIVAQLTLASQSHTAWVAWPKSCMKIVISIYDIPPKGLINFKT